jgi:hypothetical protein
VLPLLAVALEFGQSVIGLLVSRHKSLPREVAHYYIEKVARNQRMRSPVVVAKQGRVSRPEGHWCYAESKRPDQWEEGEMDIGLIFDNILGLAGVFLEMGLAALKMLALFVVVFALVLPAYLALRIHHRRRQRAEAARAAGKAGNRDGRGTKPHPAPPATRPEGIVTGGGVVRTEPAGFLEDPEAWILRQYPSTKGMLAVNTLALLGMMAAGLGAGLVGLLRFWAIAAPDVRDEESSLLGSDEILEPNNILDSPYPGAGKPLVSKYLRPPRDGHWLDR